MSVCEALRNDVRESGLTLYRVSKDAGVAWNVLKEFMEGACDVRTSTLDALARYFKRRLV